MLQEESFLTNTNQHQRKNMVFPSFEIQSTRYVRVRHVSTAYVQKEATILYNPIQNYQTII